MAKPTVENYLRNVAPDTAIIDMTEQYAIDNNPNSPFNTLFFYHPNGINRIPFRRIHMKYEGKLSFSSEYSNCKYTKNGCNYAIIMNDKNNYIDISGATFVCGVAF